MEEKPKCVFLRLPQVLEIFPISRSSWWQGCKEGRFPKPIKLGPRTTVWRKSDIEKLAAKISGEAENDGQNI
jgi:predicted DNA-binding transcriptional regulator AlpA